MRRKKGKDVAKNKKVIPKDKPTIHLDKEKFIPFKQNISQDPSLKEPYVPFTVADALARQKKKDK